MKLIISNNRVIATLTDQYDGPHEWIFAPEDFDDSRAFDYIIDQNGNLTLPAPPEVEQVEIPEKTLLEILESAVEARLDFFAKTRGYSSIGIATTYINSIIDAYKNEAEYAIQIRDDTWVKFYEIMNDESRDPPVESFSDIVAELPVLAWPEIEVSNTEVSNTEVSNTEVSNTEVSNTEVSNSENIIIVSNTEIANT